MSRNITQNECSVCVNKQMFAITFVAITLKFNSLLCLQGAITHNKNSIKVVLWYFYLNQGTELLSKKKLKKCLQSRMALHLTDMLTYRQCEQCCTVFYLTCLQLFDNWNQKMLKQLRLYVLILVWLSANNWWLYSWLIIYLVSLSDRQPIFIIIVFMLCYVMLLMVKKSSTNKNK